MTDQGVPESWHIPRALSDETLRLLTSLPEDEIQRRLRMEPADVEKCLIEPPSWCDDGQAHAWHAGWEARDDMLLQPWPPVPVSERLPVPKDCDEQGRCWFYTPASSVMDAYWVLRKPDHQRKWDTHWLPANALPLPEAP